MRNLRVQLITEVAIIAALSVILSYVKFSGPWVAGGSVSLEMLPLFLFAIRRGVKWGLVAGFIYGILNLIIAPYVVHPVQLLLDYPIAFMVIGFGGIFKIRQGTSKGKGVGVIILATTLGAALRFFSHFLSGWIFFGSDAPHGQSAMVYSFFYNMSYMLPSYIVATIILIIIWFVNQTLFVRR